jgi:glycosyltransferase involved in cell wall biosynthesis
LKRKVTFILYQINKALAFEWIIDHINTSKFEISIISIGVEEDSVLEHFCAARNVDFHLVKYNGKKQMPTAIYQTYKILKKIQPAAVHCHIFEGGLIGMIAAKLAGIKSRIYTRHYSTYHHTYAPSGVKYDKLINALSTKIIAISENVRQILIEKENVSPQKIVLVHHGFDLNLFYDITDERIDAVQKKYNPENKRPVIGVVSRYTHWKGVQYIIPAFKKLLENYPNALLVLSNAKGEYKNTIQQLLSDLPKDSYTEILFEQDNAALFKLFDVFVHVPIDKEIEAFGQIYVEALAVGIPSVFTLSGIASDFIQDKKNALVVDYHSSEQIYHSVIEILENKALSTQLVQNGKHDLETYFSLSLMIEKLEKIYSN